MAREARRSGRSSTQVTMKAQLKSALAKGKCTCARVKQARSAPAGDSRSSSTESRRIHSVQSCSSEKAEKKKKKQEQEQKQKKKQMQNRRKKMKK